MHWREVEAAAADGSALVSALQGSVASEFGGTYGKLLAEACGAVPDLDGIETALRDGVHGVGSAGLRMLEEVPAAGCGKCGTRMESYRKTSPAAWEVSALPSLREWPPSSGPAPWHRGRERDAGGRQVIVDIVKDDSYGESSRKLRNTAGIGLGSSSIHRWVRRMSVPLQRFEREEVVRGNRLRNAASCRSTAPGFPCASRRRRAFAEGRMSG